MNDAFKIYVDQLRHGHTEHLEEEFPSHVMDVEEKELKFFQPIKIEGEAYLAEDELILHLNIETSAQILCSICNEPVEVPISLQGIYHTVPLEECKSGIFLYQDVIREAILVETPRFAECKGSCPKRKEFKKYLRKEGVSDDYLPPEEGQKPFAHLE